MDSMPMPPESTNGQNMQVILITGTRRGIGRYLAEHFVCKGARVVGCSREPLDWQLNGYTHVVADISREQDVKALMGTVQRTFGRLDVAINNAGIASMNAAL